MTKKTFCMAFLLQVSLCSFAVVFPDDFKDGWNGYIGKTVTFDQRMYLCARHYSNATCFYVSYKRIQCEEETGTDESDMLITLYDNNSTDFSIPSGAYVDNLTATVTGNRTIKVTAKIDWQNTERRRPDVGKNKLKVVSANIQKYYYNWNKSTGAECTSAEEFGCQTNKIVRAFLDMDADIYAIQEIEESSDALQYLAEQMNETYGDDVYTFIKDKWNNYNYTQSGFLYNKNTVQPYGAIFSGTASSDHTYVYRMRVQCFEEKQSGKKFYVSVNHFKAKDNYSGNDDETRMQNARNLMSVLKNYTTSQDILVVGDFNNYSSEEPCQYIVSNGYTDLTKKYSPDGYSYCYNNTVGYLDHAFANKSMEKKVTGTVPYNINSDFSKNFYGFQAKNSSLYHYSDHDPILIGIDLDVTNGIEDIFPEENTTVTDENVFSIYGMKVGDSYKGIIIRNGKKYLRR